MAKKTQNPRAVPLGRSYRLGYLPPLILLALFLSACNLTGPVATAPVAPASGLAPTTTAPSPTAPSTAAPLESPSAAPAVTIGSSPSAEASPSSAPTPTTEPSTQISASPTSGFVAADLALGPQNVVLYPVPTIYAGDKVTFQILPNVPASLDYNGVQIEIQIDGTPVAAGPVQRRNWNGQAEAVFEWAWDTANLTGDHEVRVVLDPQDTIQSGDEDPANNEVISTVTVQAAARLPQNEATAKWITTETSCCFVNVVSGTAAERDLTDLIAHLESAVAEAATRLGEQPDKKLNVYFIDRVLGQGGFAGSDMVVSYVDRRYAGGGLHELLVHEAVHVIDQQFAPQRIAFLAEGVAVWASGGHYKAEDINQRSAALLKLNQYVPLAQLIDDFYPVQHEIGYLEAAGLVSYLVDQKGWATFREFYSSVSSDDGPTLSAAVDANLQTYYGKSLTQVEADWQAYLRSLPDDPAAVTDLAMTLRYYEVMRHYQQLYDPTAYFLNAWLPHPTAVREQGNPADLSRSPASELNITLELMLHNADNAAREGDYERAKVLLDSVENILNNNGLFIDPLSNTYLALVRAAQEYDYELQDVDIQGNTALAVATQAPFTKLTTLNMELRGQTWAILSH